MTEINRNEIFFVFAAKESFFFSFAHGKMR